MTLQRIGHLPATVIEDIALYWAQTLARKALDEMLGGIDVVAAALEVTPLQIVEVCGWYMTQQSTAGGKFATACVGVAAIRHLETKRTGPMNAQHWEKTEQQLDELAAQLAERGTVSAYRRHAVEHGFDPAEIEASA